LLTLIQIIRHADFGFMEGPHFWWPLLATRNAGSKWFAFRTGESSCNLSVTISGNQSSKNDATLDEIIQVDVKGPAPLLGPRQLVVKGGVIVFWLETVNQKGIFDITVHSQSMEDQPLRITVE
jgi:hypothetical protein